MTFEVWLQTVGAVFAGGLLFGSFAWGFIAMRRDEARGGDGKGLPARYYFAVGVPALITAAIIYSLR